MKKRRYRSLCYCMAWLLLSLSYTSTNTMQKLWLTIKKKKNDKTASPPSTPNFPIEIWRTIEDFTGEHDKLIILDHKKFFLWSSKHIKPYDVRMYTLLRSLLQDAIPALIRNLEEQVTEETCIQNHLQATLFRLKFQANRLSPIQKNTSINASSILKNKSIFALNQVMELSRYIDCEQLMVEQIINAKKTLKEKCEASNALINYMFENKNFFYSSNPYYINHKIILMDPEVFAVTSNTNDDKFDSSLEKLLFNTENQDKLRDINKIILSNKDTSGASKTSP
ncbi:MAG: hypothetical protein WBQ73_00540 [Candidatus Babeliales bacterium]